MRNALAAVSVAALCGTGGLVAWFVLSRPHDAYLTSETVKAFNLQTGPAPVGEVRLTSARAPRPADDLRDSVAAAPSPRPIPFRTMAGPPAAEAPAASAPARPAPASSVTASHERWARRNKVFVALLRAPAGVLMAASSLRNPRSLRAFLEDKRRVDSYMNSPLVRIALNSPSVAKAIVGSPALVRAFLASSAMRDAGAVHALLSSRMTRKILDCPGVQDALADPAVIARLTTDPATVRWLGENPEALRAIAQAAPALAQAFRS